MRKKSAKKMTMPFSKGKKRGEDIPEPKGKVGDMLKEMMGSKKPMRKPSKKAPKMY